MHFFIRFFPKILLNIMIIIEHIYFITFIAKDPIRQIATIELLYVGISEVEPERIFVSGPNLKTVDKVVYRRENSWVQAKVSHVKLAKIRSDSSYGAPRLWGHLAG